MHTPPDVIKTRVQRCRAYFNRYGCRASIVTATGLLDELRFYGSDGREVRARAVAWAHAHAEQFARIYQTAWQDVRQSNHSPY